MSDGKLEIQSMPFKAECTYGIHRIENPQLCPRGYKPLQLCNRG